ncbi:hypothetical protein HanRHA438_Chr13g0608501 [Helianthus annuus]|nr:hypothetical protein HanRHA438_Chr13g0608501 [Helianthus annuus]
MIEEIKVVFVFLKKICVDSSVCTLTSIDCFLRGLFLVQTWSNHFLRSSKVYIGLNTTIHHHHPPPSITTTTHHRPSPPPPTIVHHHHHRSPPTTVYHHHSPPPPPLSTSTATVRTLPPVYFRSLNTLKKKPSSSWRLHRFGTPLLLQMSADVVRRLLTFYLLKNKQHLSLGFL